VASRAHHPAGGARWQGPAWAAVAVLRQTVRIQSLLGHQVVQAALRQCWRRVQVCTRKHS